MSSVAEFSDYGEFGSDEEEIDILNNLLSKFENDLLTVTDIEDYENPRGLILPKSIDLPIPPSETTRSQVSEGA